MMVDQSIQWKQKTNKNKSHKKKTSREASCFNFTQETLIPQTLEDRLDPWVVNPPASHLHPGPLGPSWIKITFDPYWNLEKMEKGWRNGQFSSLPKDEDFLFCFEICLVIYGKHWRNTLGICQSPSHILGSGMCFIENECLIPPGFPRYAQPKIRCEWNTSWFTSGLT